MIKAIPIFTVVCDNCGADADTNQQRVTWDDAVWVENCSLPPGYIVTELGHYCPKCWSYDDDGNLVLLAPSPSPTLNTYDDEA